MIKLLVVAVLGLSFGCKTMANRSSVQSVEATTADAQAPSQIKLGHAGSLVQDGGTAGSPSGYSKMLSFKSGTDTYSLYFRTIDENAIGSIRAKDVAVRVISLGNKNLEFVATVELKTMQGRGGNLIQSAGTAATLPGYSKMLSFKSNASQYYLYFREADVAAIQSVRGKEVVAKVIDLGGNDLEFVAMVEPKTIQGHAGSLIQDGGTDSSPPGYAKMLSFKSNGAQFSLYFREADVAAIESIRAKDAVVRVIDLGRNNLEFVASVELKTMQGQGGSLIQDGGTASSPIGYSKMLSFKSNGTQFSLYFREADVAAIESIRAKEATVNVIDLGSNNLEFVAVGSN